jgi:hypothetical protein
VARFTTIIGDGATTIFDIDVGFISVGAIARLFDDTHGGAEVIGFGFFRQVPTPTSVRFVLTGPPAAASILVKVSDGTEVP